MKKTLLVCAALGAVCVGLTGCGEDSVDVVKAARFAAAPEATVGELMTRYHACPKQSMKWSNRKEDGQAFVRFSCAERGFADMIQSVRELARPQTAFPELNLKSVDLSVDFIVDEQKNVSLARVQRRFVWADGVDVTLGYPSAQATGDQFEKIVKNDPSQYDMRPPGRDPMNAWAAKRLVDGFSKIMREARQQAN